MRETRDETPCTCGVGTMFYSHLHPADCPFSRAGVLPPPSELDKARARLAAIDAAAQLVRAAESEEGLLFFSSPHTRRHVEAKQRLTDAIQKLVYVASSTPERPE